MCWLGLHVRSLFERVLIAVGIAWPNHFAVFENVYPCLGLVPKCVATELVSHQHEHMPTGCAGCTWVEFSV